MSDPIAIVKSALIEAQDQVDATLSRQYERAGHRYTPNLYALPIGLRAIDQAVENGAESIQDITDAAFHGRLRGALITVLRQRGHTVTR
jgi:hypothetical protein